VALVVADVRVSGGKNELSDREAGNQSETDKSVRALLATHEKGIPIVLIADDNYRKFPYNLKESGIGYVVLGYYVITAAWRKLSITPAALSR
jgi:F420-dependent methylenetetrahydromethanopterin dehydrogenase